MHHPRGYEDDPPWVADATCFEPLAAPEPRRQPSVPDARRALWFGVLAVVCFGLIFGPLALAVGQRARLALAGQPESRDAGVAHTAIALGKLGMALHLAILLSAIPWVLFMLPLLTQAAGH
jgi:hypothetical protein